MFKIEEPFHGAILSRRHGEEVTEGLKIRIQGVASLRDQVMVNGQPAERAGPTFTAGVVLQEREEEIFVTADGSVGHREHKVRVIWDKYPRPRYGFSIDDSIFFLRDIAQKRYSSLFDCFYLNILRKLHKEYKTRFVLNIYYTTGNGFKLRQFPHRYKTEWQDNADWLKLAFHGYCNELHRPYQDAPVSKLTSDFDMVAEEIIRFAGKSTYLPTTIIHSAMVQVQALPALVERGVRVLGGHFQGTDNGWDRNYFLDDEQSEYLSRYGILMEFNNRIVFSTLDLVCNVTPIEQIIPRLELLAQNPNRAEIMNLSTHEKGSWSFDEGYVPDHSERLDATIHWVTKHGYEPVFLSEGFLGIPD